MRRFTPLMPTVMVSLMFLCLSQIIITDVTADDEGVGGSIGVGIRFLNDSDTDSNFVAADIPLYQVMVPLHGKYLQMTFGGNLLWGISDFFYDQTLALGFQLYPFGKSVSVYGKGHFGTFLFNNITLMSETGVDIDIPVGDDTNLFLGGGLFYRKVNRLAEFINKDQWYISSSGIAVRFGFRFRALE